ncbi:MAG: NADPH2:quinone reductase [Chloroflexi bacterium]|jgi:putative PIG3 family NAD(P)H quinone oxidoreductase|nr:MAG: NADPH2:quinone reductase [Chloroflexota bacterium]|tara:strand:+ start:9375 stop:10364 length:990 start_codon:yes stop_codon:yes gene_type:complete
MKAIIISKPGESGVLTLHELPDPIMDNDEVLVEVAAAGINRADLLQRRGLYPSPRGYRDDMPGLEISGKIVDLGNDVPSKWHLGQNVMSLVDGEGYASLATVNHKMLMSVPQNVDIISAAAIPEVFLTAYDALVLQCGLKMKDKILLHAVGSGVGTAAIQIAKQYNCDIFGTASSEEKLQHAKDLGLNHGINYKNEKFDEYIADATNKQGVDIILDLIGSDYFNQNIHSLSIKGRLIVVGLLSGSTASIQLGKILRNRLQVIGTVLRSRTKEEKIALTDKFSSDFLHYFDSKDAFPVIDKIFLPNDAQKAHDYMEKNLNIGKILLDFKN